ncbi:MAG: hypothetical protein JW863_12210 [Chitinispirillaceae bacterium]|nr:hypothetical protein [Chitinispirillaceae bacterium]
MNKPTIIDKRSLHLEDITKADFIPFLGGRPKRTFIITPDDIINLRILLNTTLSVTEFIKKM